MNIKKLVNYTLSTVRMYTTVTIYDDPMILIL